MPCIVDLSNGLVHLGEEQGVGGTAVGAYHEKADAGRGEHHRTAWNPFHSGSMITSRRKGSSTLQCDNSSVPETQR
jgi:hypothetical protein